MTIVFTDEERRWLSKKPFNWSVKKGCPEVIRKTLEKKLRELERFRGGRQEDNG